MAEQSGAERIGLLFVHGIGEQKRWEHLKSSVQELAELLLQTGNHARVTVTDRTEKWSHPAGRPDPDGIAPITIDFTADDKRIAFDCHEVWWADLGDRAGIGDAITFWLWGLGQWCAPIYRELDAAALPKQKRVGTDKPVSRYATVPESVAGTLKTEPLARLQLVLAALAALFVACTWSLAKRVLAGLLGQAPSPTLIVRYVGDVRTYEARAAPGDSPISDPGRPRRVGIRRRMVSEMIALGTGRCDGWYVIAHSLGTVLAYNGLTETGHALPNYLTEEQWGRVPAKFRRDKDCERRKEISAMMPARPPWLVDLDVINRPLLFKKLRGLLTYGSPLDKFAGLWPRIVATATDRTDGKCPFPAKCRWINLIAPSDPVAGQLDSYGAGKDQRLENAIPQVENCHTPWNWHYGLSHIEYFSGVERFAKNDRSVQKRAVTEWLLGEEQVIADHKPARLARFLGVQLAYPLLIVALWAVTAAFVVLAFDTVSGIVGREAPTLIELVTDWCRALRPVLAAAMAIILLMGLWRWWRESRLNVRLAKVDKKVDILRLAADKADEDQVSEREAYWDLIIRMLRTQRLAALLLMLVSGAATFFGATLDWGPPRDWSQILLGGLGKPSTTSALEALSKGIGGWWTSIDGWWTLIAVSLALLLGAVLQTLVNKIVPPLGKAPG